MKLLLVLLATVMAQPDEATLRPTYDFTDMTDAPTMTTVPEIESSGEPPKLVPVGIALGIMAALTYTGVHIVASGAGGGTEDVKNSQGKKQFDKLKQRYDMW
jgi:hypothetical protein